MVDEFEFDTTTRPTIVENDPNIAEESDEYVSDKEGEPATEPATEPQATSAEPTKQEASGETSLVLLFVHVGILAAVSGWVNAVVPDPYMDEVFHIPQAQYYCVQKYSVWNPKITTPPGLPQSYAISDLFITPVGLFTSAFICTPSFLRAINRIFSIITYLILARLLASVHARRGVADDQLALAALALVMFPVAYFYNFLYYTDSGSTLFVLWAYLCARDGRYMWSGIISAISVTFRQTNIVWVCFLLGISLVRILSTDLKVLQPKKSESEDDAKDDEARLYNPLVAEVASIGIILSFPTLSNLVDTIC
ncbi:hypothetical protein BC938DRAFT_473297 [Jimgerdemannia flammicorona]|uniref:Dol-P-Glc:Glc(2)Man(9)GlcNAc(2)-PP-Dol alpha-1,2-glucosyltransferase n=1 Tax=Jimgerdemannia flammicorona TaxID=994334 RepID=A0A433QTI0_9FUNG|nr:hypothetical protein BC938DRAFT_473297 [Jimgerdemannia flammicorona]